MTTSAVVVIGPDDGVVPAEALPLLRTISAWYATPEVDAARLAALPAPAEPPAEPIVLFTTDPRAAFPARLRAEGATVIGAPAGYALLAAVATMDRLRSPGGCPWDAEQTHESLRRYLIEETYELLDAIEHEDRDALREELGDVLLQVLFHARITAEDSATGFDIDDVARELVDKLVGRHPHVFAGTEAGMTAAQHERRWEEVKQVEKRRESIVDGVAVGQPATALAGKLGQRAGRAELPDELYPEGDDAAVAMFRTAAEIGRSGADPEGALRAVAKRFAADIRTAEAHARGNGLESHTLTEADWRKYWPVRPAESGRR